MQRKIVGLLGTAILLSAVVLNASVNDAPVFISETVEVTDVSEEVKETEPVEELHYLTDEELSRLYTCKQDIRTTNPDIVELSQSDAWLLMQIARSESGESLEGQLWSMKVIINRLYDNRFPNTVWEIVSEPGQFQVFSSGYYKQAQINSNTHLALAKIEGGWDDTDGSVYFESASNGDDSWHMQNLDFVKEVNGQRYYK